MLEFINNIISIPLATPFIVQSPSLLEEDNFPPITRAVARRGERTTSPVRTNLLPEFEIVGNSTPHMATNTNANKNQNQTKIPRSKRPLASVFRPLKLSDNLDAVLDKYYEWLPKFKGNVDRNAHDHVDDFFWMLSPRGIEDDDVIMMLFALSFEGKIREWYLSLLLGSIVEFDKFEDAFVKR